MKKFFTFIAAAFVAMTVNATAMTVAEAYAYGMTLDSAAVSPDTVTVEGYVINAGAFSMMYKNQTWYMADSANATTSDFEAYNCYAIDGNDTLKVLNGDKVSVTGKLKKFWNKSASKFIIEFEKANATFITMTPGDHTVVTSIEEATVAQALTIGAALADNAATEKQYKITGYVSAINVKSSDAWSDQYKNQSFWVADEAGSTAQTNADGAFYVFRGKPETEEEIPLGARVEFTCTIKKYVPSGGGDAVIENADQNITIKVLDAPVSDADVVFEATDFAGLGRAATLDTPGDTVSLVKEGVTFFCDNAYGTDTYGVRCYKDGHLTISADTTIGKIVFELYGTYTGGLDAEVVVNANSWSYTLPSQARMTTISIYFGEAVAPVVESISVADALLIGAALDSAAISEEKYNIEGYVTSIVEDGMEQYGNMTFWMADEKGSTAASNADGAFEVYRGKPDVVLAVGDKIRVETKIQNFHGNTIESVSGAKVTKINDEGIENIVLTEKAQKVMVDGILYIVRDGKMYNVQGTQVR